ncbi:hypothetical protein L0337_31660 [candidate division KSB1 bacterium]|nr:hypothetical protein [candidate division KSB1 bacterium]
MKNPMNSAGVLLAILAFGFFTRPVFAQDAAKVDSTHFKVEFENDQVRVLRVTAGPGEKSVMYEQPEAVVVFLTDVLVKVTFPDGTTPERAANAGQVIWNPAEKLLPENINNKPLEAILIELKVKPAAIKKN